MYEVRKTNKFDELLSILLTPEFFSPYSFEELDALLAGNPNDLQTRARLVAKHFHESRVLPRRKMSQANNQHILWFVKNTPHLAIACECSTGFELDDTQLHSELVELWSEHVEKRSDDFNILFNASMFFRDCWQVDKAIEILRKIEKMKGNDRTIEREIEFLEGLHPLSKDFKHKINLLVKGNSNDEA